MTGKAADGRKSEKLGYLGLGMMGLPMSRRLLNAGHEVAIWNRSVEKAKPLIEMGAKRAANPRDVAASSSIIFMCVTDAAAVEDVVFGAGGLARISGTGKIVVTCRAIVPIGQGRARCRCGCARDL